MATRGTPDVDYTFIVDQDPLDNPTPGSGVDWGQLNGSASRVRTRVAVASIGGSHSSEAVARYISGSTLDDSQWAGVKLGGSTAGANGKRLGVIINASSGTGSSRDYYAAYMADLDVPQLHVVSMTSGTETEMTGSPFNQTVSDDDWLYIENDSGTIRAFVNDTEVFTDASPPATKTGGLAGVLVLETYTVTNGFGGTGFQCGNFSAASSIIPQAMHHYRNNLG